MISLIGRTHTRAVPEYIVTNTANTIDIGLEPMQLAVNKRDSQMGKANLQIIYEDEKGTGVPLRIRRIVVSTEKALALPTTDSSVTLCSLNMVGVDWGLGLGWNKHRSWSPHTNLPASVPHWLSPC